MDTQKNIMASIVAILTNNGLTELSLGDYDELHDPAYIVWFDDDGSPYDDPVIKVMVEDNTVSAKMCQLMSWRHLMRTTFMLKRTNKYLTQ